MSKAPRHSDNLRIFPNYQQHFRNKNCDVYGNNEYMSVEITQKLSRPITRWFHTLSSKVVQLLATKHKHNTSYDPP